MGKKPGEVLAKPHPDKSGFTFHLHESLPGLQVLGRDHVWYDVPLSARETIVFPGMQLQYKDHDLKALWHRVVATPGAEHGRYSMVYFVEFKRTPEYKKKDFGSAQELALGSTYSMSPDEFRAMFS